MAITYPIALPATPAARRITLSAVSVTGVSVSPFTLDSSVFRHQGEAWRADIELPPMVRPFAEPWIAALNSLKGAFGTFLLGDPFALQPQGVGTGTPVTSTIVAGTDEILTTGWTPSISGILLAGDWIELPGNQLCKVMQDVNSDGAGSALIDIFPRARTAFTAGQTINVNSPQGIFRRLDNEQSHQIDHQKHYRISFSAVQAF